MLVIIIAISLSMDAFSLALAYGTLNLNKKDIYKLSLTVGVYHFIMPLLGLFLGSIILKYINNPNIIVFIILFIIGIQMIYETFKEEDIKNIVSFKQMLLFGLAVSVDSFSVGIGLNVISKNYLYCSTIFSFFSLTFTYLGLILGRKINNIIGKTSTIIGGLILIIIAFMYLI